MQEIKLSGKLPDDLEQVLDNNIVEVTEFFEAVSHGSLPIMSHMLKTNKLLITERNLKLQTPLHVALKEENLEAMQLLLEAGADIYTKDLNGDSCFEIVTKCTDKYDLHALFAKYNRN